MLKKLKSLFSKEKKDPDGLIQSQREATIDLLLLCMFADNNLAFSEERILAREIERFNWKSVTPVEIYIENAKTKIHDATSSESSKNALLRDISERLGENEVKYRALKLCKLLCYSDWQLSEEEETFIQDVRKAFKIK